MVQMLSGRLIPNFCISQLWSYFFSSLRTTAGELSVMLTGTQNTEIPEICDLFRCKPVKRRSCITGNRSSANICAFDVSMIL